MHNHKIKPLQLLRIYTTNKTFILYDVDNNNRVTAFKLTDSLKHRNNFKHFRLVEVIKKDLKYLTI